MKKSDTLSIAKEYRKAGFSVIPLQPKSKKPAIPWREYQKRLPTEKELEAWFGNGSRNNIGIVTGAISGLAVLDADSAEAVAWCEANLPKTPAVKTARVILVGGTALARCYLQHRISFDLDFFVNTKFDPIVIQRRLSVAGVKLRMVEVVNEPMFAIELHGVVDVDNEPLRVSIVEDIYADIFPIKTVAKIRTETIEGLYHRKLRTITGSGEGATSSTGRATHAGARQTARDLFDLYVLSSEIKPLMKFVREINKHGAGVPEALLISGIRKIRWLDLMDEFGMLQVADRYKGIKAYDIKRYFDEVLR